MGGFLLPIKIQQHMRVKNVRSCRSVVPSSINVIYLLYISYTYIN